MLLFTAFHCFSAASLLYHRSIFLDFLYFHFFKISLLYPFPGPICKISLKGQDNARIMLFIIFLFYFSIFFTYFLIFSYIFLTVSRMSRKYNHNIEIPLAWRHNLLWERPFLSYITFIYYCYSFFYVSEAFPRSVSMLMIDILSFRLSFRPS
jgi:hypothetical protein